MAARLSLLTMLFAGGISFALKHAERYNIRYSLVGNRPFYDPSTFDWVPRVEARWREIRAELDRLLVHRERIPSFHDVLQGQEGISEGDQWKTYMLYLWGRRVDHNCRECPATADALAGIPGLKTGFFSILGPRKHIPLHRGPYNGLLRYHLGLRIPGDRQCWIKVGDETGYWEEGRSLVFDDTFQHEALNDTDGLRVVLFVDFLRPLKPPMARVNETLVDLVGGSGIVEEPMKTLERYRQRFSEPAALPLDE